jgi:SAM-dependent methyltransferase
MPLVDTNSAYALHIVQGARTPIYLDIPWAAWIAYSPQLEMAWSQSRPPTAVERGVQCDLCGGKAGAIILLSPRLDGPLVRCSSCGLCYVANSARSFTFNATSEVKCRDLADRVAALDIVRPEVEEAEERWRTNAAWERLERVRRHVPAGRLLDVGAATGLFLRAASGSFDALGIEPDPYTSQLARDGGLHVQTGTLDDVDRPAGGFDAVTMFHVIEHLASPRESLIHARSLMRRGGVLVIETPTIDTLWFTVARGRWRQLLPDHYFFFNRRTLGRLLVDCGFSPVEYGKVGRQASLRFVADRARRAGMPLAGTLKSVVSALKLDDVTIYLKPGDIMSVTARAC